MKKLVVLGGGESGVGAAILGKDKGMDVFLSDMGALKDEYRETLVRENIEFEEGRHSEERILDADIVVKSPGIPPYAPMVRKITDKNIPVLSDSKYSSFVKIPWTKFSYSPRISRRFLSVSCRLADIWVFSLSLSFFCFASS